MRFTYFLMKMKETGVPIWSSKNHETPFLCTNCIFRPSIKWKRTVPTASLETNRASLCRHNYLSLSYDVFLAPLYHDRRSNFPLRLTAIKRIKQGYATLISCVVKQPALGLVI